MAKVEYSVLVTDVRKRVGNVVFSKWKKTHYLKPYVKPAESNAPAQVEARDHFSKAVRLWRGIGDPIRRSWEHAAKGLNMTGYNLFIGVNAKHLKLDEQPELSRHNGEFSLQSISVAPGADTGSVAVSFIYPEGVTGKTLVLAAQKWLDGEPMGDLHVVDAGVDPTSPFQLKNLEPDTSYLVFGILTDAPLASATKVSRSQAAIGLSKA